MGTNFYWFEKEPCECCKRPYYPIHIGKSSGGWAFALHIYRKSDLSETNKFEISNLRDWKELFDLPNSYIENEYGDRISIKVMMNIITMRTSSVNVKRHTVDHINCVGHGPYEYDIPGCYDYLVGEFS